MRLGLIVLIVACGSAPPRQHSVMGLPTAGETIAQLLPPGADSCTVSRTGAVSDARRSLVRRVSTAGPVAWSAGAPFVAYAEAIQRGYARGGYRAVIRVSDLALARTFLEQDAPVRVGFDEDSCPSSSRSCWRAQVVDERTIRLALGDWDSELQGVELRCARMAREHPDAIEVGVTHHVSQFAAELGEQLVQLGYEAPGFESEIVLRGDEFGISRSERIEARMESDDEAMALVDFLRGEEEHWAAASRQRTQVTGDHVLFELGFVWEDLELADRDEQRMRHARALEARDELPLAVHDVDVRNLPLVRAQLRLHEERIAHASGQERRGHIRTAQMLLQRAIRVYPADESLNHRLAVLYLEDLHDGAAAAELATNMLASNPTDRRGWQLLRRRALSSVGAAALRDALIEDGVFDRRGAGDVAEALVGFTAADYESAEGALAASGRLSRLSRRTRRIRTPTPLPIASVVEALLSFVDDDGPSQHVFLELVVDGRLEQGGWGNPDGRVLTWPRGARSVRYGASLTDAPLSLRDVANGLFVDINDVDVELVIAAVPMGTDLVSDPTTSVRIRGHVRDADLLVTATSVRADWAALSRYVALPFAELEGRLFPPPDMSIDAEDEEVAQAIVDASEQEPVLRCTREGAQVDCAVSPELDVTRRAWRRVVWPRVLGRSIPTP